MADSVMGRLMREINVFNGPFDMSGKLGLYENGLVIKKNENNVRLTYDFIRSINSKNALPMGKVEVVISYMDYFGNSSEVNITLNDNDYVVVKTVSKK